MDMQYKVLLSGKKKTRKDKKTVLFLSKKEMKEWMHSHPEAKLIGGTRLKKRTAGNEHKADFLIALFESDKILYVGKKKQKGLLKGYFQVSENEFIEYRSYFFPLIFLLGIGLLLSLIAFIALNNQCSIAEYDRPDIYESEKWDGIIEQSGKLQSFDDERIEIPGYHELYISEDEPFILLGNPDGNTVLFKYSILESGRLIYESEYIAPGNKFDWKAYDILQSGNHELTFVISTVDKESYYPCNGASLSVKLNVN